MQASASHYVVRLSWGLGLLLLPAVQQHVCTAPAEREVPTNHQTATAAAPASNEDAESKPSKRKPLTLAEMVPDVLVPRWPGHTHLTAVERGWLLPASTWLNGPTGGGQADGSGAVQAIFGAAWPRIPASQRLPARGNAGVRLVRAERHTFQTSIQRTGPPSA